MPAILPDAFRSGFAAGFGEAAFREVARQSNQDPIPRALSLYAHIAFCFSPCFYCGCNRVITRDARRGEVYLDRLVREIAPVAPLFDRDREVVQLHLGGGTPNFLANGEFNHSSVLILLDRDGRVLARTEKLGAVPDPAFVAKVKAALAKA